MVIRLISFTQAVWSLTFSFSPGRFVFLSLLSRAVLHLSLLSRRWSISQFIGIGLGPGEPGSRHRHLLPKQPSGFGGAAPAPHRACRGGSAPGSKWFRAVASPEPELLPLLQGGSVSLAVGAVAAREGRPHEGADVRDLGSHLPFELDCLGPPISSPRRPQLMQYPRREGRGHARRLWPYCQQLKQWPPGGSRTGSTARGRNPPKITPVTFMGLTEGSAVDCEVEAERVADGFRLLVGGTGLPAGEGERDGRLRRCWGS